MTPHTSTRFAWSIAVAALALWATSVPSVWGQVATASEHFFQTSTDESTVSQTGADDAASTTTVTEIDSYTNACPTVTPAASGQPAASAPGATQGTFHLCGADADTARSIEQLIAGRSFSSTLSSHGDGCADLTIQVTSSGPTTGTASSSLKVSLGAGKNLSIKIESAGGVTHVGINQGQ